MSWLEDYCNDLTTSFFLKALLQAGPHFLIYLKVVFWNFSALKLNLGTVHLWLLSMQFHMPDAFSSPWKEFNIYFYQCSTWGWTNFLKYMKLSKKKKEMNKQTNKNPHCKAQECLTYLRMQNRARLPCHQSRAAGNSGEIVVQESPGRARSCCRESSINWGSNHLWLLFTHLKTSLSSSDQFWGLCLSKSHCNDIDIFWSFTICLLGNVAFACLAACRAQTGLHTF